MINHIRTLLLNRSAAQAGVESGTPGAEYIPAEFRPIDLPPAMADVRALLFPRSAGSYQEHCLLAYIMRLLHTPDMTPYTLRLDPRYTYRFDADYVLGLRDAAVSSVTTESQDCNTAVQLRQLASRKVPGVGQTLQWAITHTPEMGARIRVQYSTAATQEFPVSFSGTSSQDFTLVPDALTFRLRASGDVMRGSFTTNVECALPVELRLSTVVAGLERLDRSAAVTGWLFEPWSPHAVTLTDLQTVWRYAPERSVRLSAAFLAYAWQCERLRLGMALPSGIGSTLRRVG